MGEGEVTQQCCGAARALGDARGASCGQGYSWKASWRRQDLHGLGRSKREWDRWRVSWGRCTHGRHESVRNLGYLELKSTQGKRKAWKGTRGLPLPATRSH